MLGPAKATMTGEDSFDCSPCKQKRTTGNGDISIKGSQNKECNDIGQNKSCQQNDPNSVSLIVLVVVSTLDNGMPSNS